MDDLNLTPAPDYSDPGFDPAPGTTPLSAPATEPAAPMTTEPAATPAPEPVATPEPPAAPRRPALAHLPGEEPSPRPVAPAAKPADQTPAEPAASPQSPVMAGTPQTAQPPVSSPRNDFYLPPHRSIMPWAILTTLFCCQLGGLISIILSAKSNSLYSQAFYMSSDPTQRMMLYEQSESKNKQARLWIILSLLLGIVVMGTVMIAAIASTDL